MPSDATYRRLIQALAHPAMIADQESGEVLDANPAAAVAYGYSREELIGMPVVRCSADEALTAQALKEGQAPGVRIHRRKDGTVFPVEVATSIAEEDGRRLILGVAFDVSKRVRAEEALQRSEELYRTLVEASQSLVWRCDAQGRFVFLNQAWEKTHGYRVEEMIGRSFGDFQRPEVFARDFQEFGRHLAGAPVTGYETTHLAKDGREVHLLLNAVLVRERDGTVIGSQGTAVDITERKREEHQLRLSEALLKRSQAVARVGHWVWDLKTDRVEWSDEMYRIYGLTRETAPGSVAEIVARTTHPDDRAKVNDAVRQTRAGQPLVPYSYRIVWPDQSVHVLWASAEQPLPDAAGKPHTLTGIIQDITDRSRLEANLAEHDRLAMMGLLANGLAHEINNPLAYVLFNLETVAQELPALLDASSSCEARAADSGRACSFEQRLVHSGAADGLAEALLGARRLKEVSRRLSLFSRVEKNERAQVDLNFALESAALAAQNELKFRAKLHKQFAALPPVRAMEGKLAQAFLNLLLNAAEAIDDGEVEKNQITVRTWAADGSVFAEIADTGRGISPAILPRIFEPFFTTKGAGRGSGLGLSIARKILNDAGGELRLESELGKGTRAIVRLPAQQEAPATPAAAVARPSPSAPRGRILVIDDELPIVKMLGRALAKEHDFVAATSGREAQALLEKDQAFDLILCDVMMAEVSGVELHRWLAVQYPALAQRLVFISGGAFLPRVSEYLESVNNLRVDKPFNTAQLRTLVTEFVAASKAKKMGS